MSTPPAPWSCRNCRGRRAAAESRFRFRWVFIAAAGPYLLSPSTPSRLGLACIVERPLRGPRRGRSREPARVESGTRQGRPNAKAPLARPQEGGRGRTNRDRLIARACAVRAARSASLRNVHPRDLACARIRSNTSNLAAGSSSRECRGLRVPRGEGRRKNRLLVGGRIKFHDNVRRPDVSTGVVDARRTPHGRGCKTPGARQRHERGLHGVVRFLESVPTHEFTTQRTSPSCRCPSGR